LRGSTPWNKGLKTGLSSNRGKKLSDETRFKLSVALSRRPSAHSSTELGKHFRGGRAGEDFAAVLCPVGFVREYKVFWGGKGESFALDFAHPEGQVNIELDGPGHASTPLQDRQRDEVLRHFGWRIIRIKHGRWR
jgi:hypothetical protein